MIETDLLPRRRCQELFEAAARSAARQGAAEIEVTLTASNEALTRFANNEIHQNVAERASFLSVRAVLDHRTARATTNRLDAEGIADVVEQAVLLTKSSEPDPDLQPLYEDDANVDTARYAESAARCGPAERARSVGEAIRRVESEGQTAAGIYSVNHHAEAVLNSRGVYRYYHETLTQCSITAMGPDSSGWAKASSTVHEDVDPVALARRAARKAKLSANPRELEPGRYTVVLEPAAVLDLVGQIFPDFSGTALHDQRSFLNERLGQKLFGETISIWDHADCPLQTGAPFDGEGVPRRMLALVERGIPKEVAWSRAAASRTGVEPTGHGFPLPNEVGEAPVNIVMAGGRATLDELVAGVERGILVTRLWYIREVEPYDKIMTGMTRDGTFLIENGEIAGGLKNFRFNQSVVELLNHVEAMSESVRASGEEAIDMVVPGMKVHEFHFTEVTRF
ncbi:MAG: TldD/PmbA family protein [Acidobacteria bacterium]|nr:TldD/PmbA family protein [Acidobacteriota bacterium]